VRTQLKAIFDRRRGAGDKNLHYLDGLGLFSAADLAMMPDQLHPNADGHRIMAQRFGQLTRDVFGGFANLVPLPN
jgi:lysophospholipase L1-like esterase